MRHIVKSPAVGDVLYDSVSASGYTEAEALLLAVRHVRDNGADADVVTVPSDAILWQVEARRDQILIFWNGS